jgi:hypothetical protein
VLDAADEEVSFTFTFTLLVPVPMLPCSLASEDANTRCRDTISHYNS